MYMHALLHAWIVIRAHTHTHTHNTYTQSSIHTSCRDSHIECSYICTCVHCRLWQLQWTYLMFCVLTFPLQKQITHIYNYIYIYIYILYIFAYVLAVLEPALVIGPVVGAFFLLLYTVVIAIIAIAMTKKYKGQFSPVITKACHVLLHVHTKLVKSSNLCAMHLALRVLEDQMLHALYIMQSYRYLLPVVCCKRIPSSSKPGKA